MAVTIAKIIFLFAAIKEEVMEYYISHPTPEF